MMMMMMISLGDGGFSEAYVSLGHSHSNITGESAIFEE